jgi:hypothetical protein
VLQAGSHSPTHSHTHPCPPLLPPASRSWGSYQSEDVCCAPGAAFQEGCSAAKQVAAAAGPEQPSARGSMIPGAVTAAAGELLAPAPEAEGSGTLSSRLLPRPVAKAIAGGGMP